MSVAEHPRVQGLGFTKLQDETAHGRDDGEPIIVEEKIAEDWHKSKD